MFETVETHTKKESRTEKAPKKNFRPQIQGTMRWKRLEKDLQCSHKEINNRVEFQNKKWI